MKELKSPIFYHPDECDCVECDARRQPGGLDHDPSNDNAEFEKHEEEMMAQLNPRRGDLIRFKAMNEFTGKLVSMTGKVVGKGSEIRKKYPVECALVPENYSLVERDTHGTKTYYVVTPEDVEEIQSRVVSKEEAK